MILRVRPLNRRSSAATSTTVIQPTLMSVVNTTDTLNVRDFGAVGTGMSTPLSTKYASLAAAQAVYPHATALTNELDWIGIQGAVNYLGSHSGGRVFLDANFYIIDQPISVIGKTRVMIAGCGQRSQISSTTAGLEAMIIYRNASQGAVRDLDLKVTGAGTATYGLLITSTSSTHAVSVSNVYVECSGGGVITNGFGVGCDTVSDTAQNTFYHCTASGGDVMTNGFLLGNGTAGNVLDTRMYDIVGLHCQYGVNFAASAACVFGFAMDSNSVADFHRGSPCSSPILIAGGRSESSGRFWDTSSGGSFSQPISLRDVSVASFTDAAGKVINHITTSPLSMYDCTFRGGPVDVTMILGFTSANPTRVCAMNIGTAGTVSPFTSPPNTVALRAFNCACLNSGGATIAGSIVNA